MRSLEPYVIPESDLVVVITANIPDEEYAQPQLLIQDYVMPAVTAATRQGVLPGHVYYWGDRHRDVFLGPERAARVNPLRSAMDRGIVFTGHHDAPVMPADMMVPISSSSLSWWHGWRGSSNSRNSALPNRPQAGAHGP